MVKISHCRKKCNGMLHFVHFPNGSVAKYKAGLVAKGYHQEEID